MFGLGTILPVVGGAFGLALGGLGGGSKGAVLGAAAANLYGKKHKSQNNFGIESSTREGSRLSSLKIQISSYGEVIPKSLRLL
ncbi:hypothetical protein [Rickettsia endosymbiont of Halotydeus destructor]|uniref:hypothetical protein n=1 Tax=Rickettsia endosymbiont of Halotydeus destructor TaxID=2996754 RepID=UPI003BAE3EC7